MVDKHIQEASDILNMPMTYSRNSLSGKATVDVPLVDTVIPVEISLVGSLLTKQGPSVFVARVGDLGAHIVLLVGGTWPEHEIWLCDKNIRLPSYWSRKELYSSMVSTARRGFFSLAGKHWQVVANPSGKMSQYLAARVNNESSAFAMTKVFGAQ